MAGKFILAVFAVVALLVQSTTAVTYTVGDNLGWTVPPSTDTYPNWASPITFRVGDILVFNFAAGAHDVATVTKQALDSCNTNSPLTMQTVGPVAFSLNNIGEINFICTFGSHCILGQKFSINVTSAAPSPTTTPVPAVPSPPPTTPGPTAPSRPTTPGAVTPSPSVTPTAPGSPSPSSSPPTQTPGVPTVSPNPSTTPPSAAAPPPGSSPSPPTTTSTPPPPNTVSAPPPPSSATRSLTVVGFMGTMLAIAMGLTL